MNHEEFKKLNYIPLIISDFLNNIGSYTTVFGAMANRVYLKNLTFSVDKNWLLRAINLHGVPAISVDAIQVVRKSDPFWSTNRECSAFLTYDTEEQVHEAVGLLDGKFLDGCSWRPIRAEKAIPRIKTLVQTKPTTDNYTDLAEGSSGAAAVAHLMEVKKEEQAAFGNDLHWSSAGAQAVAHMVEMKKEQASGSQPADLQEGSSGAKAVAHMIEAKRSKRSKSPSNEKPWHRRQRLRENKDD